MYLEVSKPWQALPPRLPGSEQAVVGFAREASIFRTGCQLLNTGMFFIVYIWYIDITFFCVGYYVSETGHPVNVTEYVVVRFHIG